ncbi:MAG: hypothetical protein FJ122_12610 [Deltaproteobacteria bacterium]|nr:hypothetical protein [Deltaproteobacteria bacterium]
MPEYRKGHIIIWPFSPISRLPAANGKAREWVKETLHAWNDVDMVVSPGKLCRDRGTDDEYASVEAFYSRPTTPDCKVIVSSPSPVCCP